MNTPNAAWQDLREREFPMTSEYVYLNAATQAPLPNRTRQALEQAIARAQFPQTDRSRVTPPIDVARARLASLLRVSETDLVFTSNTTHGLNICTRGIAWRPGDNVVLPAHEFPSVMAAWLALRPLGVEVRLVPWQGSGATVEQLMAAVDARTRVVSCSAVAWTTGYRMDLEELGRRCATAGCLLVVDGIQAVGALDLDMRALRLSALSFHGYKWLLAGFGCGALYVAPDAIDRIQPTFVGPHGLVREPDSADEALEWKPGAQRYAGGTNNMLGLTALAASLELLRELDVASIEAHNARLVERLLRGLQRVAPEARLVSSADPARRSAITVFTLGERARDEQLVQRLDEQRICVALRPLGIRVAPHCYNNEDDIDRLLEALV